MITAIYFVNQWMCRLRRSFASGSNLACSKTIQACMPATAGTLVSHCCLWSVLDNLTSLRKFKNPALFGHVKVDSYETYEFHLSTIENFRSTNISSAIRCCSAWTFDCSVRHGGCTSTALLKVG